MKWFKILFVFFTTVSLVALIYLYENTQLKFSAKEHVLISDLKLIPDKKKVLKNLKIPISPANPEHVAIGKKLFLQPWKNKYGIQLSCASCHNTLNLPISFTQKLAFDPPALVDTPGSKWLGWTGSHLAKTQFEEKILAPLFNSKEHNLSSEDLNAQMRQLGFFGGPKEFAHFVKIYLESIELPKTRFDKGLQYLNSSETRGLKVFAGKGKCVLCHNGPRLSNGSFHNVGVPLNTSTKWAQTIENNMEGRITGAGGTHRTPCLRCSLPYPPYFHNGVYVTLEEVIEHYNLAREGAIGETEISPLNLEEIEKRDLLSFLRVFVNE